MVEYGTEYGEFQEFVVEAAVFVGFYIDESEAGKFDDFELAVVVGFFTSYEGEAGAVEEFGSFFIVVLTVVDDGEQACVYVIGGFGVFFIAMVFYRIVGNNVFFAVDGFYFGCGGVFFVVVSDGG
jgi:hypothetical protein